MDVIPIRMMPPESFAPFSLPKRNRSYRTKSYLSKKKKSKKDLEAEDKKNMLYVQELSAIEARRKVIKDELAAKREADELVEAIRLS